MIMRVRVPDNPVQVSLATVLETFFFTDLAWTHGTSRHICEVLGRSWSTTGEFCERYMKGKASFTVRLTKDLSQICI